MFITNANKVILFVLVSLAGCAYADKPGDNKVSALQVSPKSISTGENFLLTFPKLHPKHLSFRSPSGKWYSVQNNDEGVFIVSIKEYNSATELKVKSKTLMGVTWVKGKKVKEKVFQEYGEYLVYMANNIETEPENTFHFSTSIVLTK